MAPRSPLRRQTSSASHLALAAGGRGQPVILLQHSEEAARSQAAPSSASEHCLEHHKCCIIGGPSIPGCHLVRLRALPRAPRMLRPLCVSA